MEAVHCQDVKLFAECNSTSRRGEGKFMKSKKSFIMQIKLAQKESCARLGKAQKFHSGKIARSLRGDGK